MSPDLSPPLQPNTGKPVEMLATAASVEPGSVPVDVSQSYNVAVVPFDQLTPALMERWEQVRATSDRWTPPFFATGFSAAVQQSRGDVLVAVLSEPDAAVSSPIQATQPPRAETSVGFLPFHRVGRVAVPAGRFLNDAQGVIGLAAEQVDWSLLLHACDVVAFDLHAITHANPDWIEEHHLQTVGAFQADFAGDSPGYLRQLEKDHRTIGKQGQKTRKLGREIGTIRLEVDCRCPDVLAQAIAWKRDQYQRTHILDLFFPDWTRRLVEVLHGAEVKGRDDVHGENLLSNEPLRGILSVLWAGDQAVAAHYGMIERGRLHYWFPTYDPEFARYSPGTALFTELVRAATQSGIDCIDMGYGEQPYKQKQTATTTQVAFGTITHSRWHRFAYDTHRQLVAALKQMPMKSVAKRAWRAIHPTAGIKKLG